MTFRTAAYVCDGCGKVRERADQDEMILLRLRNDLDDRFKDQYR